MADSKLSALVELAAAPAATDELYIRDVSEPAADESKRITVANLISGLGGTPAPVLSTTNAAGAATTFLRTNDQLAIFDATVPVTQASADAAAAGTAAVAARRDHRHGMPTLGSGAVTRAGGNTTEATTTSTTEVSLLTTASLSIAAGVPITAFALIRKTTGAADQGRAGLMINATAVTTASNWSNASNAAQAGTWHAILQSALTTYDSGGVLIMSATNTAAVVQRGDAACPVATITDIIVRANVGNAAITMGADEMHVYSYAVS